MGLRAVRWAIFVPVLFAGAAASAHRPKVCTRDDAIHAEQALDGLTDWRQAYNFFWRYDHCDDGAVAEGYDDRVVGLLTKQWSTVRELAKLCRQDQAFQRFVLKHIDTLMSAQQADTIATNAQRNCPAGAAEICKRLKAASIEVERRDE